LTLVDTGRRPHPHRPSGQSRTSQQELKHARLDQDILLRLQAFPPLSADLPSPVWLWQKAKPRDKPHEARPLSTDTTTKHPSKPDNTINTQAVSRLIDISSLYQLPGILGVFSRHEKPGQQIAFSFSCKARCHDASGCDSSLSRYSSIENTNIQRVATALLSS
jgi:hypothetical protein